MGIPIISEVFDGLRWIIDFFINKTPRPVQIIFFLLFLFLFTQVITFTMHLVGLHCTTDKVVVKNEVIDITGNLNLIWIKSHNVDFDENVTLEEMHPYRDIGFGICQRQYILTSEGCYDICDNITTDPNCNYYYSGGDECYSCNSTNIKLCEDAGRFFGSELLGIGTGVPFCSGNATSIDWSFFQKYFRCNRRCEIPDGYTWSNEDGVYLCIDDDICGVNATSRPINRLDDALQKAGAVTLYTSDRKTYRNLITFRCNNNLDVDMTFFGIPIFDYKLWLIIIVIAVMFIFLSKIKVK